MSTKLQKIDYDYVVDCVIDGFHFTYEIQKQKQKRQWVSSSFFTGEYHTTKTLREAREKIDRDVDILDMQVSGITKDTPYTYTMILWVPSFYVGRRDVSLLIEQDKHRLFNNYIVGHHGTFESSVTLHNALMKLSKTLTDKVKF